MRVITLLGGHPPEFHLAASAAIVLVFVLALVPAAVAAAFTTRWWRWVIGLPTTLLLLVTGFGIASSDIAAIRDNDLGALGWVAIYVLSAVVMLLVVAQLVAVVRMVDLTLRGRQFRAAQLSGRGRIAEQSSTA